MEEYIINHFGNICLALAIGYFFTLYIGGFLGSVQRSTRIERTTIAGYLGGNIIHLICTIIVAIIFIKFLYEQQLEFIDILSQSAFILILFVVTIVSIIVLSVKLNGLPKLPNL